MAGVIINKKGVSNDGRSGGVFVGDRHSAKSGGIPVVVDGGGSALVESDEPLIIPEAVNNPKLHSFNGKKKTAKEILSEINTRYKGVAIKKKGGILEKGGLVKSGLTPIDKILILAEPLIEKIVKERITALEKKGEIISEYESQFIRLDLTYDLTKALGNYLKKDDEIIDPYFKTEKGVIILYARVKRGDNSYRFLTQMIVAGGKNVQVRHYRYLVDTDLPHNKLNDATKNIDIIIKSKKKNERILSEIKYNENTIKRWQNEIEQSSKEIERRNLLTKEEAFKLALKKNQQFKHIFQMTYFEAKKECVPVAQKMTEEEYKKHIVEFKNELIEDEKGVDKTKRDISNKEKYIKDLIKKNDKIKLTLSSFEHGGTLTNNPIPVKSGSVIITRNAYLDNSTKNTFNGKKMTNREVLSKINAEGGGVEFEEGGKVLSKAQSIIDKYDKGGKLYQSEISLSEKKAKLAELESDYEKICSGITDKEIELKSEIDRLKYEWDEVKYSGISDDKLKNIGSSIIRMSDELVHDINNLFPIVNKSPFSSSIYSGKKDWGFTEIDSYTVADHFNFYSKGAYHKLTTTPVFKEIKKKYPNYDFENSFWVLAKFIKGARCYDENKWDLYNSTCKTFTKELTDASIEAYPIKESGGLLPDCGCHEKGGEIEEVVLCQNCGHEWETKGKNPNYKYLCFKCTYNNEKHYK